METTTSKNTSQESDGHPAALNDAEFKKELANTKANYAVSSAVIERIGALTESRMKFEKSLERISSCTFCCKKTYIYHQYLEGMLQSISICENDEILSDLLTTRLMTL